MAPKKAPTTVAAAAATPLPPAVTAKAEKIAAAIAEAAPGKKTKKAAAPPAAVPKKAAAAPAPAPAPAPAGEEAAAPKAPRAMTPYNKFMKLRLHEMKEEPEYADKTHAERFAAIGPVWKAMTEAEKAEAVVRAEQYIEDLNEPPKAPKAPRKKRGPKEEKVKRHRVPTAYNYFMAHRISVLKTEQPDLTHGERFTMAASEWKTLEGEEKENAIAEAMLYHEQHPKPAKKGAAEHSEEDEDA